MRGILRNWAFNAGAAFDETRRQMVHISGWFCIPVFTYEWTAWIAQVQDERSDGMCELLPGVRMCDIGKM